MSKKELCSQIKNLRELTRMADELNAEIEAAKDAIKALMTEQGVDTLTGDDFKVTWKSVQSSRFDSKKFKADHADIYAQYTRKTETRRFVLA